MKRRLQRVLPTAEWVAPEVLRRLVVCLLSIGMVLCLACIAFPANAAPSEESGDAPARSVKAAYLYKFLSYVEWPPASAGEQNSPITIGVIGADDVATELSQIMPGRTVNNRPLAVKRLKEGDPLSGIQLVFIGQMDSARIYQLLKAAQQQSVLSVTESSDALAQGSVINFMLVDGRIRFEVSLEAAEKSNLKLSSRMLAIAHSVQKGAQ
jgi:hypothetical protein